MAISSQTTITLSEMSVVTKSYSVSMMVFVLILCFTSAIVWCAAWYTSKRFHDMQREMDVSRKATMFKTVLSTLAGVLIMRYAKKAWVALRIGAIFEEHWNDVKLEYGRGGPRDRARNLTLR